ncbi:MAG: KamA family radical SAM protein [Deltaproteobacteria bacterium]|nr:KamA family radical SAM protein [Deltaproteobacteria bacterium]
MTHNSQIISFAGATYYKKYSDWHDILSSSITTADELAKYLPVKKQNIRKITEKFPMRINPYYLSLIKDVDDPVWKQSVPDMMEINLQSGMEDPLAEEAQSPVPNLIHRYPDRVLFMVSDQCAMYCRHCMRKRRVGTRFSVNDDTIKDGLAYIRWNKAIRDVLISGGDPLLLENEVLDNILLRLRAIDHVEIIRIHSRVPCTLPQRVTWELAGILKKYIPLYINIQFNLYDEITPEATKACSILADAGLPLGCQSVLLKGVNDTPEAMKKLVQGLLKIRVKPYYIHNADFVEGTCHFRTSVKKGLKIMQELYGHTSGLAVPHYMIDLPEGGGKVPLVPEYIVAVNDGNLLVKNYEGKIYKYPV